MKQLLLTLAALATCMFAACDGQSATEPAPSSVGEAEITLAEAEAIYDYAYPLVIMKISQDLMLTVPIRPTTTPNHFIHFNRLTQPEQRAVVLGNRNTLYSVGWVDLSTGPVVFEIPDMGDRYYVMPLLDAWTNTFASLGSRTTGQGAQTYLLAHSDWEGDAPDGYEVITSPTNMVWITGRIQADSAEDAAEAAKVQNTYKLMTLEEFQGGADPFADYEAEFTFAKVRLPVPYSLQMDAADFYNTFLSMLAQNGLAADDTQMSAQLAKAGISADPALTFADLPHRAQDQLVAGLEAKQAAYTQAFYGGTSQTEPWIFNLDTEMGDWGTDYARRAYWAVWGLGTNISQDAVYGVSQLDETLAPLNGASTYRIHFEQGATPPTTAFWSITNYDIEGYLERNALDRYSLGSNHDLSYNEDGSLDIFLAHDQPADDGINWIPTPQDDFKTLLRIYWPDGSILAGEWSLPNIEKIEP